MSSVCSSSSVNSSLGGNVGNLALFHIESLGLSVGFQVDEKSHDMLDRLFWESTVMMIEVFAHGVSSWSTGKSSEWNNCFMFENSFHILNGFEDIEASASSGCFIGVLKMCS